MKKNYDSKRYNFNENNFFDSYKQNINKNNLFHYIENFPIHLTPNYIRKFLARHQAYMMTKDITGSIFECGVGSGFGFFIWIHLRELFEPFNHNKKVIGFDTFKGFPKISKQDVSKLKNKEIKKGGLNYNNYEEINYFLQKRIEIFPLKHIDQFQLIKGDATKTVKKYLKSNPHTLISLLYLDFDNYIPTLATLKNTMKNMSKGSIICFDETSHEFWPGEAIAIKKFFKKLNKVKLERFEVGGNSSFYRVK